MSTTAVPKDACSPATAHAIGEHSAAALAPTLKALADPLRLRMLSAIASDPRGEACVCDLAALADVSQPTISHHLKVLRDVGMLTAERRGTWVWYRVTTRVRPAVMALLESFAPVAVDQTPVEYRELENVDDALAGFAGELAEAHPSLSADLVTVIVRESYTSLARSPRVTSDLLALTERFARQRLSDIARDRGDGVPQVLFVCVANAGRSQLAAAMLNREADGRVVARSAGSNPAADIHATVRPLLAEITGADSDPFPKPLTDDAVRAADVVVTMGCGDVCPVIPGVRYEDWAVGDPALASEAGAIAIQDDIARRVSHLLENLLSTSDPGATA